MVLSLIDDIRAGIDGELSDRSRLTDHLLDLRLAAADLPAVVSTVDRHLGEMPGRTTVPNEWWSGVLDELTSVAVRVPTG